MKSIWRESIKTNC